MIFGSRCIFCEQIKKKQEFEFCYRFIGICRNCMSEIEKEKIMRIFDVRKPLSMVIPCTHYAGKVRHAMYQYKFENNRAYKKLLSYVSAKKLEKWTQLKDFDAIVTLPISKARMNERGYNQSVFMAQTVSEMFNIPQHDEYLKRIKNVQKQSSLKNVERIMNISGANEASPEVRGKNIILADDIYTTGATMTEAARALKNAGANVIAGVVFAAVKCKSYNENIFW